MEPTSIPKSDGSSTFCSDISTLRCWCSSTWPKDSTWGIWSHFICAPTLVSTYVQGEFDPRTLGEEDSWRLHKQMKKTTEINHSSQCGPSPKPTILGCPQVLKSHPIVGEDPVPTSWRWISKKNPKPNGTHIHPQIRWKQHQRWTITQTNYPRLSPGSKITSHCWGGPCTH